MPFLLRRLLRSLALLIGVSFLSFLLLDLAPGDYFDTMLLNPQISPATVAAIRSQYGLNRPLPQEYWSWIRSIGRGDWGYSLAYNLPAAPLIWQRARYTLLLSGTATALAWIAALALGIWSSARPHSWIAALVRTLEALLMAIPELVLALSLLLIAVWSGIAPAAGASSSISALQPRSLLDLARHLLLPCLSLALGLLPLLLLHVRSSMRQALDSPFVNAARAYGIRPARLLFRHALPVAANPLISLFGLSIGLLMSSSLVTETVFSWPGIGSLMVTAILDRDFFVVVDCTLLAAIFLLAGNFLADLLLFLQDPRVRAS
ncbi:MAG TPA: ABC transporter permease [Bryobacteraceae bacterium]|jgi:peptide/nickel transport system permease protein|nr:ABC transporter permease [Bryobacteraceae bacterium]